MDVIAWLAVGIVAGAVARLLLPGRDPIGPLGTVVVGLIGSVIGGWIGNVLLAGDRDFAPGGPVGSIVGAVVALVAVRAAESRRTA